MKNTQKDFWDRVKKMPSECWEWQGFTDKAGYGQTRYKGPKFYTHRLAYELENGPIPKGMFVMHKCDNPPCCNPAHLSIGTPLDNMIDRDNKNRNGKCKKVKTPVGEFNSLKDTASFYNITTGGMRKKMRKEPDKYYFI